MNMVVVVMMGWHATWRWQIAYHVFFNDKFLILLFE
jgi:hypothetical protein